MKVLVNGGLNLSELDGWWAEAYTPEVGWALGDGREHEEEQAWDASETDALFTLLEQDVIPSFYDRDEHGIPVSWVARVRESMARLTPRFSANRTVREYSEQYYLPAAAAYRKRVADKGALGVQVWRWQRTLSQHWSTVRLGDPTVAVHDSHHMFHLPVYLGDLPPEAVRVELYADPIDGNGGVRYEMHRDHQLIGALHGYVYTAQVPATRPAADYTARVVPYHPDAMVPLEAAHILWQR
jgi:starch phosphorylase